MSGSRCKFITKNPTGKYNTSIAEQYWNFYYNFRYTNNNFIMQKPFWFIEYSTQHLAFHFCCCLVNLATHYTDVVVLNTVTNKMA